MDPTYSLTFEFDQTGPGLTSSITFDASKLTSSNTDCPIIEINIIETTTPAIYQGLTKTGCPTPPDLSVNCRKVTFPTDIPRMIGKTPPEYTFKIEAQVLGGGITFTDNGSIQIIEEIVIPLCTNSVIITKDPNYSLDFIVLMGSAGSK